MWWWFALSLARAEVIDRVVAVVEEQLVTASDVALEADLARIDESPVPFWIVGHGDSLHRLIDAAVIRELAGDVALYRPSDEAVGARIEAMRGRFRSPGAEPGAAGGRDRSAWQAFLARRGLDEESLRGIVERRMVVEAYLSRNVPVAPTDPEGFVEAVDRILAVAEERLRIREIP